MLEPKTLEDAIDSTLKELEEATTNEIFKKVKVEFEYASKYSVEKILSNSHHAERQVRKHAVNLKDGGSYEKSTQVWVYTPSKKTQKKELGDFDQTKMKRISLKLDLKEAEQVLKEYANSTESDPMSIEEIHELLRTVTAENSTSKKLARDRHEIREAIKWMNEQLRNDPSYFHNMRRELEDQDS